LGPICGTRITEYGRDDDRPYSGLMDARTFMVPPRAILQSQTIIA
jgi:hypothetical protein